MIVDHLKNFFQIIRKIIFKYISNYILLTMYTDFSIFNVFENVIKKLEAP